MSDENFLNQIYGTTGADSLVGTEAEEWIWGNDGADTIRGASGNDSVFGRDGDDELHGEDGDDYLSGYVGNDSLYGDAGNDDLSGGGGNDLLDGGDGTNVLDGGSGDDAYFATANDQIIDVAGNDTVTALGDFTLSEGLAIEWLFAANDIILTSADIALTGNALAQVLGGNAGDNILQGAGGADTIMGGAGDDTASYATSGAAVDVDLNRVGAQTGGDAAGDILSGIENLIGSNHGDRLIGAATSVAGIGANNTHDGGAGNDYLSDLFGENMLIGGLGDDTLVGGGTGAQNVLKGGAGNDTYIITSANDIVDEFGGTGTGDLLLISQANWSMDTYGQMDVERATLVSGSTLTANTLDNILTGNTGINTIWGMRGDDTIYGGAGGDKLHGGDGDDVIYGGTGYDLMTGGAGNDIFYVTESLDVVTELEESGTDTVITSTNFTLSADIENLVMANTGAMRGTGNALDNVITGNAYSNIITGGDGADTLIGGVGGDTYYTDGLDTITELANGGQDWVHSSGDITLSGYLEYLQLTGTAVSGTGNSSDNLIRGNASDNTLSGLAGDDFLNGYGGDDTLTGGTGYDTFIFSSALTSVEVVTDFSAKYDTIQLENAVFTGLANGRLSSAAFRVNESGLAQDADDRIIYEKDSGKLYFDKDGAGGTARVHFATLDDGLTLTTSDFFVI